MRRRRRDSLRPWYDACCLEFLRQLFHTSRFCRQLVLCEERDFPALDPETVLFQIDASLMSFEHVETEEEIDIASLEHRKSDRKEQVFKPDLRAVNSTEDLGGSDTACNTLEAFIHEPHDTTLFCTIWTDDRTLRS